MLEMCGLDERARRDDGAQDTRYTGNAQRFDAAGVVEHGRHPAARRQAEHQADGCAEIRQHHTDPFAGRGEARGQPSQRQTAFEQIAVGIHLAAHIFNDAVAAAIQRSGIHQRVKQRAARRSISHRLLEDAQQIFRQLAAARAAGAAARRKPRGGLHREGDARKQTARPAVAGGRPARLQCALNTQRHDVGISPRRNHCHHTVNLHGAAGRRHAILRKHHHRPSGSHDADQPLDGVIAGDAEFSAIRHATHQPPQPVTGQRPWQHDQRFVRQEQRHQQYIQQRIIVRNDQRAATAELAHLPGDF